MNIRVVGGSHNGEYINSDCDHVNMMPELEMPCFAQSNKVARNETFKYDVYVRRTLIVDCERVVIYAHNDLSAADAYRLLTSPNGGL